MLRDNFLNGFASELVLEKRASHPLFSQVVKGGTLLGRKVKGMMTSAIQKGQRQKFRMKKKAEDPLKLPSNTASRGSSMDVKPGQPAKQTVKTKPVNSQKGTTMDVKPVAMPEQTIKAAADAVEDSLRRMLEEASPDAQFRQTDEDGGDIISEGSEDSFYGGGLGNLGGKKAPKFNKKYNPTDMPQAFGKKTAAANCGPKYGCGNGKHGTGCGLRKKAVR